MRMFGRNREPLTTAQKQPETFVLALDKYKNNPYWTVQYRFLERVGSTPSYVADISIRDTLPVGGNIQTFIQETYGSGVFKVSIVNAGDTILCSYTFNIGGAAPYRSKKAKQKAANGEGPGKKKRKGAIGDMLEVLEAMKALKNPPAPPDTTAKDVMMKFLASRIAGGPSGMEKLVREMLITKFRHDLTREEGDITRLKSLIELSQVLAPKVPKDGPMTSIIQAAPALMSAMATMKSAPAPAAPAVSTLPAGNGGVDIGALKSLADSLPPEIIQQFPENQRRAILQLRGTARKGAKKGMK